MGKALGSPTVTNVWIPDGYKDTPVDRLVPRQRLSDALDKVFAKKLNPKHPAAAWLKSLKADSMK